MGNEIEELASLITSRQIAQEDLWTRLWQLSQGHERKGMRIKPENTDFYRTRVFEADAPRPVNVSELTYAPSELARLNRANQVGESIFYASVGMPTTLAESRVKAGQVAINSRWKSSAEVILSMVGFEGEHDGLEKLYHDIFTSPGEELYQYSSVVAKHLMSGEQLHGLLYPSIINNDQAHNMAIKPEFVDQNLRLVYATATLVKSITDNVYEVEHIDFAKPDSRGVLNWVGRQKRWTLTKEGEEIRMESNGWDWNGYLADGSWVEPE